MFGLGELGFIVLLVIVLLLFGPGRIAKVAGELGKGLKSFKDGITGTNKEPSEEDKDEPK